MKTTPETNNNKDRKKEKEGRIYRITKMLLAINIAGITTKSDSNWGDGDDYYNYSASRQFGQI